MYPGIVYIIECDNLYKIGRTTDLFARLSSLRTGSPKEQTLIWSLEVENCRRVEKFLHMRFRMKRVRGEWFALSPEDLAWIEEFYEDQPGELRLKKL